MAAHFQSTTEKPTSINELQIVTMGFAIFWQLMFLAGLYIGVFTEAPAAILEIVSAIFLL